MSKENWLKMQDELVKLKKRTDNPYYKSKYVELTDVLEYIKPILSKYGFILKQYPKAMNNKNYLMTEILGDNFAMYGDLELITAKPDMQQLGSALTYARRYSLVTMLNLETEDDDGNNTLADKDRKPKKTFEEMSTFSDFVEGIASCKTEKQMNALYYIWSKRFDKGTEEYKELSQLSSNMKLSIGNPESKVDISFKLSEQTKQILGLENE